MRRLLIIAISLTLCASASAQILQGVMFVQPATVTVTPAAFGYHSGSNTGTNSLTTLASGTTTCAAYTYCTSLPQPILSGNGIVVFATYVNAGGSVALTVKDDQGDTFTHASCEGQESTSHTFADVYYILPGSVTAGARGITVKSATTAVTWASVTVAQMYNVTAYDTCGSSASASTTGTYTGGSLTTTASNDLAFQYVVNTTTSTHQNTGTFVAGSGFSKVTSDRRDGSALQVGVIASSGTTTPQMTTGTNNTYVSVDVAFRAGTAGTAPSGMYIVAEQHQSTAIGGSGSFTYDMPAAGANLLVTANQCGGTTPMAPTGITDTSSNTWVRTGPDVLQQAGTLPLANMFYAANVTGSSTNTLTYTTSGTGDCSMWMYAIAGAATSPFVARMTECDISQPDIGKHCYTTNNPTAASTFSPYAAKSPLGFYPGTSSGLTISTMGVGFNTVTSQSSPSGDFDADLTGGENLDGPWPVDENNALGNVVNSNNSAQTWTWGLTSSTTSIADFAAESDSFAASGATIYPSSVQVQNCVATASGTTLTCAITPQSTGHIIAIMASDGSGSAHNITISDGAGNTIANAFPTSGTAATIAVGGLKSWYIASVNTASSDTFTLTWSASNTYRSVWIQEISGATALDQATISTVTTAGGAGAFNSASVTTTAANELILGWNVCAGTCSLPASGVNLGQTDANNGQLSEWKVVTSSGSNNINFLQPGAGNGVSEGAGILTFK